MNSIEIQKLVQENLAVLGPSYIGGEPNLEMRSSFSKRICFVSPYDYNQMAGNLSMPMLVGLVNHSSELLNWCAERCFNPLPKSLSWMKSLNIPLFSIDSHEPLANFDVLGFSVPFSLAFIQVPRMLKLAGIEPSRLLRKSSDPLIIAGGPTSYSPFAIYNVVDAVCVGNGERYIEKFLSLYEKGMPKEEFLHEVARWGEGWLVPMAYDAVYEDGMNGAFRGWKKHWDDVPDLVKKALVKDLNTVYYPEHQYVHYSDPGMSGSILFLSQGCGAGTCRFCVSQENTVIWQKDNKVMSFDGETVLKQVHDAEKKELRRVRTAFSMVDLSLEHKVPLETGELVPVENLEEGDKVIIRLGSLESGQPARFSSTELMVLGALATNKAYYEAGVYYFPHNFISLINKVFNIVRTVGPKVIGEDFKNKEINLMVDRNDYDFKTVFSFSWEKLGKFKDFLLSLSLVERVAFLNGVVRATPIVRDDYAMFLQTLALSSNHLLRARPLFDGHSAIEAMSACNRPVLTTAIISLEDVEPGDVRDIETEAGDFVANGMLVKNCKEGFCVSSDSKVLNLDGSRSSFADLSKGLLFHKTGEALFKHVVWAQRPVESSIMYTEGKKQLFKLSTNRGFSIRSVETEQFRVLTNDCKLEWREQKDLRLGEYVALRRRMPKTEKFYDLAVLERFLCLSPDSAMKVLEILSKSELLPRAELSKFLINVEGKSVAKVGSLVNIRDLLLEAQSWTFEKKEYLLRLLFRVYGRVTREKYAVLFKEKECGHLAQSLLLDCGLVSVVEKKVWEIREEVIPTEEERAAEAAEKEALSKMSDIEKSDYFALKGPKENKFKTSYKEGKDWELFVEGFSYKLLYGLTHTNEVFDIGRWGSYGNEKDIQVPYAADVLIKVFGKLDPGIRIGGDRSISYRDLQMFAIARAGDTALEDIITILSEFYLFDKVSTIEKDAVEDVYDLVIPQDACFDCNGFMVHNTYRPYREYSLATLKSKANKIYNSVGSSQLTLSAFNGSDYVQKAELLKYLVENVTTGIEILSQRVDTLSENYEWVKLNRQVGVKNVSIGVEGCLREDSLISSSAGLVPIGEFQKEFNVLSGSVQEMKGVDAWYGRGLRDVFEVHTELGRVLCGTPDHEIPLIDKGDTAIVDLKKGDRLQLQMLASFGCADFSFNLNESLKRYSWGGLEGQNFSLPERWTEELATLVGILEGDGYFHKVKGYITFCFRRDEVEFREYVEKVLQKWNVKYTLRDEESEFKLKICSRIFWSLFIENIEYEKGRIPNLVLQASDRIVASYLRGLFEADGCNEAPKYFPSLSQTNGEVLLHQVQNLLLLFGINSRVVKEKQQQKGFDYTTKAGISKHYNSSEFIWRLRIRGQESRERFWDKIGFVTNHKNDGWLGYKVRITQPWKGVRYDEFEDKVKEVVYVGKCRTNDISVRNGNTFYANGILVHNSSTRMRAAMCKGITDKNILDALEFLLRAGYQKIKWFMISMFPFEEEQDIRELVELIKQADIIRTRYGSKAHMFMSWTSFVMTTQTPMEFAALEKVEKSLNLVFEYFKSMREAGHPLSHWELSPGGYKARGVWAQVMVEFADPRVSDYLMQYSGDKPESLVEGLSEYFKALNYDYEAFLCREKTPEDPFAVDLIDMGYSKEYLYKEYLRAKAYQGSPTCRQGCSGCGVCNSDQFLMDEKKRWKEKEAVNLKSLRPISSLEEERYIVKFYIKEPKFVIVSKDFWSYVVRRAFMMRDIKLVPKALETTVYFDGELTGCYGVHEAMVLTSQTAELDKIPLSELESNHIKVLAVDRVQRKWTPVYKSYKARVKLTHVGRLFLKKRIDDLLYLKSTVRAIETTQRMGGYVKDFDFVYLWLEESYATGKNERVIIDMSKEIIDASIVRSPSGEIYLEYSASTKTYPPAVVACLLKISLEEAMSNPVEILSWNRC